MTIYNPISVTLKAAKPDNGGEAEGNCVVVRRGGEQPKAKKQSQIQVNSIRFMPSASLLAIGEACVKRDLWLLHHLVTAVRRDGMYGWSEKLDSWIRMRLRSIYRKRHRKRGRGRGSDHQRWPNRHFAELGLFSLVAAQREAISLHKGVKIMH